MHQEKCKRSPAHQQLVGSICEVEIICLLDDGLWILEVMENRRHFVHPYNNSRLTFLPIKACGSTLVCMSHPDRSYDVEAASAPVCEPGAFLGREGLVRNMLWRLRRGESLNVYGGPQIGKTSLLLHLVWHWNQTSSDASTNHSVAEYFDLAIDADCTRLRSPSPKTDSLLLFDNCESLVGEKSPLLAELTGDHSRAMVFAGGRDWNDVHIEGRTLKSIPLSVFLESEARQVVAPRLSPSQQQWVFLNGGTHPYLLKVLQAACLQVGTDVPDELAVDGIKDSLVSFFQRCVAQLRDPLEYQVLTFVIRHGKPVNPKAVAEAVGCSNMKSIANTLCYVGVISRWIRDEEATLLAGSQLFNEWYLESGTTEP